MTDPVVFIPVRKVAGKQIELTIRQGETLSLVINYSRDGVAIDLSDYTVSSKIRAAFDDEEALVVITATITDPTEGEITLTLTASQTAALGALTTKRVEKIGYWDVEIQAVAGYGLGTVKRLMDGEVYLSKEASK